MEIRNIAFLFSFAVCTAVGYSQSGAQIVITQATVTAGDSFEVRLTLDDPAPCNTNLWVDFANSINPYEYFRVNAMTVAGQPVVLSKTVLAKDLPAGDYKSSNSGFMGPCPGFSHARQFTIPITTMTVKAIADPNKYPTKAELELSLTQKQFLDTKIAQLNNFTAELNVRLEKNSVDSPELRKFLAQIVGSAEEALNTTEKQYRLQVLKPADKVPVFFADFRAQYEALLIELRAPVPGRALITNQSYPRLLDVQLKARNPGERLANAWPPSAKNTSELLRNNASAYAYIESSNRITFDAKLTSIPSGARVSYKKMVDEEYVDYSSPTDVLHASFELATWTFKFHKEGCSDEPVQTINPYEDFHPNISVEFLHCRGR